MQKITQEAIDRIEVLARKQAAVIVKNPTESYNVTTGVKTTSGETIELKVIPGSITRKDLDSRVTAEATGKFFIPTKRIRLEVGDIITTQSCSSRVIYTKVDTTGNLQTVYVKKYI